MMRVEGDFRVIVIVTWVLADWRLWVAFALAVLGLLGKILKGRRSGARKPKLWWL